MKLKQHIEIGRVVYKELSEQMVIEPEKLVLTQLLSILIRLFLIHNFLILLGVSSNSLKCAL